MGKIDNVNGKFGESSSGISNAAIRGTGVYVRASASWSASARAMKCEGPACESVRS